MTREEVTREEVTREEAITTIKELIKACVPYSKYYLVGEMAIKALEEESYMERWAKILNSEVNKMYIWCCPRCGTTMTIS